MITSTAFAGKHYAVLGLARSGRATVDALLASGAQVTAWDDNEEARAKITPSPQRGEGWGEGERGEAERPSPNAEHPHPTLSLQGEGLNLTDFTTADLTIFDSIVVTPGLPLNRHPIAQRAREAGVEIIGDIELFARARADLPPHKVVGITGTNGKSTTTALVHHILKTAGVPSLMGGNIGLPILAQDPLPEGGVYVLELSSYQLDLTQSLDCDVSVLLNITPDHLDRYDGFEAYAASKARLFEMQSGRKVGVFATDDFDVGRVAKSVVGRIETITVHSGEISDDQLWWGLQEWTYPERWLNLQGPHNIDNALCAASACWSLGEISLGDLKSGLESYPGLPHRMERIREKGGVLFVNDSKATNAEAAAPALGAYAKVRWIVGGQAKAENLGETERHLNHVVKAYAIGEAGAMFARMLREAKVDVVEAVTLDQAVKQAASEAQPGDTVLLSPACASFDQFTDFEARGNAFRAAVEAL